MSNKTEFKNKSLLQYLTIDHPGYDFDTEDTEFAMCVTCCEPNEWKDCDEYYDMVMYKLYELVEVVSETKYKSYGEWMYSPVCDWSGFIRKNYLLFYLFAEHHFHNFKKDITEDDLIEKWINDLHYYLAGYVSEDVYHRFYAEVLCSCKPNFEAKTLKEFTYSVSFGSEYSPASNGVMSVMATDADEAYGLAVEIVGKKLYEAFPNLDIDYVIHINESEE